MPFLALFAALGVALYLRNEWRNHATSLTSYTQDDGHQANPASYPPAPVIGDLPHSLPRLPHSLPRLPLGPRRYARARLTHHPVWTLDLLEDEQ